MQTIKVTIKGIAPILLHNGELVDPRNPFTKEIDAAQKTYKKAKSDSSFEALAKLEWLGGCYTETPIVFNRDGNKVGVENDPAIGINGDMLERCIIKAAGRKEVAAFKAGLICEGFFPMLVSGKKMTVKRGFGERAYSFTRPAKIGASKIMRTRPRFDDWTVDCLVTFNEDLISERDVTDALKRAGSTIGIGDWRPRFGRFQVQ